MPSGLAFWVLSLENFLKVLQAVCKAQILPCKQSLKKDCVELIWSQSSWTWWSLVGWVRIPMGSGAGSLGNHSVPACTSPCSAGISNILTAL